MFIHRVDEEKGTPAQSSTQQSSPMSINAAPIKPKQISDNANNNAHKALDGMSGRLQNSNKEPTLSENQDNGLTRTPTLLPCNLQEGVSIQDQESTEHTDEQNTDELETENSNNEQPAENSSDDPAGKQKKNKGKEGTNEETRKPSQPTASKGIIISLPVIHNTRAVPGLNPPEGDNLNNLHVAFTGKHKSQLPVREEGVRTRGGSRGNTSTTNTDESKDTNMEH